MTGLLMAQLMERGEFVRRWSALHGDVAPRGVVGAWLRVGYTLSVPLARARVAPAAVTVAALLAGLAAVAPAAAGGRWVVLAAALVAVSGVLDGLDGPVAVLQGRTSRWGYVLDSFCDRVSEAGFGVALWAAGAPVWAVVTWVGLGWLKEYLRARAAAGGMTGIGVVTVAERPTRLAVAAMFLLGAGSYPQAGATWVSVGAAAGCLVGVVGLGQLLLAVRRALSGPADAR